MVLSSQNQMNYIFYYGNFIKTSCPTTAKNDYKLDQFPIFIRNNKKREMAQKRRAQILQKNNYYTKRLYKNIKSGLDHFLLLHTFLIKQIACNAFAEQKVFMLFAQFFHYFFNIFAQFLISHTYLYANLNRNLFQKPLFKVFYHFSKTDFLTIFSQFLAQFFPQFLHNFFLKILK